MDKKIIFSDDLIKVEKISDIKLLKKRVLISAVPGISAISKICGDLLIKEKEAKKVFSIYSDTFLPIVTINDDGTIQNSSMDIYEFKENKTSFFVLDGSFDIDEKHINLIMKSLFSFFNEVKLSLIVTLAGIGYEFLPEKTDVYVASNSKKVIDSLYNKYKFKKKLNTHVSFIYGLNGKLLTSDIDSFCILINTIKAQGYFGFLEAKKMCKVLEKIFEIKIPTKSINEPIKNQKKILEMIKEETKVLKNAQNKLEHNLSHKKETLNYIG
jgi:proteasome assembly chaperone (PAC2) family protein